MLISGETKVLPDDQFPHDLDPPQKNNELPRRSESVSAENRYLHCSRRLLLVSPPPTPLASLHSNHTSNLRQKPPPPPPS